MAQQHLDGPQVDPRFEPVRRGGMAERVATYAFVDSRNAGQLRDQTLHGLSGDVRPPQPTRKEPAWVAVLLPELTQLPEQGVAYRHVAVLGAFGIAYVQQMPLAVDVLPIFKSFPLFTTAQSSSTA